MEYFEKVRLYEYFLKNWGARLEKVPGILKFITPITDIFQYPEFLNKIGIEELHRSQLEWVALVAQLDNPIESSFYKDYWVSIEDGSNSFFIDLSSDDFPIFSPGYFMGEPYTWYKVFLVRSLPELILTIDTPGFDIQGYIRKNEEDAQMIFDDLHAQHDELGYAGNLKESEYFLDRIFPDDNVTYYKLEGNTLTINNIKPFIINFLPFNTPVKIEDISIFNTRHDNARTSVKTVKGFVHLLSAASHQNVHHYHVTLSNNRYCYAKYVDNTIIIKHYNRALLKRIIKKIPGTKHDELPF